MRPFLRYYRTGLQGDHHSLLENDRDHLKGRQKREEQTMKNLNQTQTSRREFLIKTVPACALTCVGIKGFLGVGHLFAQQISQQEKHMFDREFSRKLTFRQYIEATNLQFIEFAKAVQKKFGNEETIELIKKLATEFNLERGRKQAENSKDRSLKSYTRMFADPKMWEGILGMEVVEDTDTAFELKVTECIQAANYIEHDAADIGYANVCWGDYAWAEGFNPKIKLVRDKTLMQGHAFCNHRYIWIG
jgi:hypothetical protein